jgi:hypothetical protein
MGLYWGRVIIIFTDTGVRNEKSGDHWLKLHCAVRPSKPTQLPPEGNSGNIKSPRPVSSNRSQVFQTFPAHTVKFYQYPHTRVFGSHCLGISRPAVSYIK